MPPRAIVKLENYRCSPGRVLLKDRGAAGTEPLRAWLAVPDEGGQEELWALAGRATSRVKQVGQSTVNCSPRVPAGTNSCSPPQRGQRPWTPRRRWDSR